MTSDTELDRIERSIDIDAPAERVWELLRRPGWWINEGEVDPEPDVRREGDLDVVTHPTLGEFRLRTERVEEPRYLSYRWIEGAGDAGTLVEFWVEDRPDGGVRLRVAESGFGELGESHEQVAAQIEENTEGWENELGAAARFVLGTSG